MDDANLLQQYVETGSQEAFRALVDRYIALVYTSARRQVHDAHAADDVTQAVFLVLARKARSIRKTDALPAWLLNTTRYAAADARKLQTRRQFHEQQAAVMKSTTDSQPAEPSWDDISPTLDQAIARLASADRQAVVLRYFDGRSLDDVARAMGTTQEAARKRIARAIDKMRSFFASAGITVSAATLSSLLLPNATQAAPPALAESVAASTFTGAADGGASALLAKGAIHMMACAKARLVAACIAAVMLTIGTGTFLVSQLRAQAAPEPRPAAAEKPAAPADKPFTAVLANGLTIEVLGLSAHPSKPDGWWQPDGSPLAAAPYDRIPAKIEPDPDLITRELAIRITNQPEQPASVRWDVPSSTGGGARTAAAGNQGDRVEAGAVSLPADRETASIVFTIANGPWKTQVAGSGHPQSMGTQAGTFAFTEALQTHDGWTALTIADDLGRFNRRIVAIDTDGNEHPPFSCNSGGGSKYTLTTARFDLLPAQIRQYRLQTRPYDTTVEFKNISLKPGKKTDVKVEIKQPTPAAK